VLRVQSQGLFDIAISILRWNPVTEEMMLAVHFDRGENVFKTWNCPALLARRAIL
jgi:hypothetical protein